MKGCSKESLEEERPQIGCLEAIDFCLDRLYRDKQHEIRDEIVRGLCFEELIGALLLARDEVKNSGDDNDPATEEE